MSTAHAWGESFSAILIQEHQLLLHVQVTHLLDPDPVDDTPRQKRMTGSEVMAVETRGIALRSYYLKKDI